MAVESTRKRQPAEKGEAKRRYRKGGTDDDTRERILNAATRVFAKHSFRAASTRMIAEEAGVDHPLIHYYFGSKEKLFEAVTERIYLETMRVVPEWLGEIAGREPTEALSLFIDRFLGYYFDHPEAQQIIFVNMAQIGRMKEIPGYRYILMHVEGLRTMLEGLAPLPGPREDGERFVYCFHVLVDSLLGAKSAHAQILGIDPDGDEYRQWVKDTLLAVFTPLLENLFAAGGDQGQSPSPQPVRNKG